MILEIRRNPYHGTGKIEQLKHELTGFGPAELIKKID